MTRRQPLAKRWSTAVRWPIGIALTSWRYMWRTTAVHRWELAASTPVDAPPDLPEDVTADDLQRLEDGVGPTVHRLYRVRIVGSRLSAAGLMERLTLDLDRMAPSEFATFQKLRGTGAFSRGDEYI